MFLPLSLVKFFHSSAKRVKGLKIRVGIMSLIFLVILESVVINHAKKTKFTIIW